MKKCPVYVFSETRTDKLRAGVKYAMLERATEAVATGFYSKDLQTTAVFVEVNDRGVVLPSTEVRVVIDWWHIDVSMKSATLVGHVTQEVVYSALEEI